MYNIARKKKIGDMYMYMYTKVKKDSFAADCLIDQVIIRMKYQFWSQSAFYTQSVDFTSYLICILCQSLQSAASIL